jgi:hypothetical protein
MKTVKPYIFFSYSNEADKEKGIVQTSDILTTEAEIQEMKLKYPLHECIHASYDDLTEELACSGDRIEKDILETTDGFYQWVGKVVFGNYIDYKKVKNV